MGRVCPPTSHAHGCGRQHALDAQHADQARTICAQISSPFPQPSRKGTRDGTHPSGTDENFWQRLENGGHMVLMAIFSRDGYVRFVRFDQNYEIEIYGEGVEDYAPGIYRLKNLD
jgi:hypothetical protein